MEPSCAGEQLGQELPNTEGPMLPAPPMLLPSLCQGEVPAVAGEMGELEPSPSTIPAPLRMPRYPGRSHMTGQKGCSVLQKTPEDTSAKAGL